MSTSSGVESASPVDEWPIRECGLYKEEYSDCKSIRARFNQYFIFGEYLDCSQWKKDYDNCVEWTKRGNKEACEELVESEKLRFRLRMRAHYRNNVWEKRTSPPEDWNKPLPEWMEKNYKNTYLDHRSKQLKSDLLSNEPERSICVIS